MIHPSLSCVLSDSQIFSSLPVSDLCQETHPFHGIWREENSPHMQRREFSLLNDVTVWRGWVYWLWVRWVLWKVVGCDSSSETQLQTKRERRGFFTRMKKKVPLLICVQSKNNLQSASAAHWGKLIKMSVSTETVKVQHGTREEEDREGNRGKKREGLKWKMQHEWEGKKQS